MTPPGATNKPVALPVQSDNIPSTLTSLPRWVLWRYEQREGKWTKPPYQVSGGYAGSNKPNTWASFSRVMASYGHGDQWAGVGIALNGDGLLGIDLDHCRNPANGVIQGWAMDVIARLPSYTEVSPSGTGIRIFAFGKLPLGGRRTGAIEMYENGRYLTVTGHHLEDTPTEVVDLSAAITAWHGEVFPAVPPTTPQLPGSLPDDAILQKALTSANGGKFGSLWSGDTAAYASEGNAGRSQADLALCTILSFWSGRDPQAVDRLFRKSGLYRPEKWDTPHYSTGETYGQHVVAKAVASSDAYSETRPAGLTGILQECGLLGADGKPLMSYHDGQAHLKEFKEQIAFGSTPYHDIQKAWSACFKNGNGNGHQSATLPEGMEPLAALDALKVFPSLLGITGLTDMAGTLFIMRNSKAPVRLGTMKEIQSWSHVRAVMGGPDFRHSVPRFTAKDWDGVFPFFLGCIQPEGNFSRAEETLSFVQAWLNDVNQGGDINLDDPDVLREQEKTLLHATESWMFHYNGHYGLNLAAFLKQAGHSEFALVDNYQGWCDRLREIGGFPKKRHWKSIDQSFKHATFWLIPKSVFEAA